MPPQVNESEAGVWPKTNADGWCGELVCGQQRQPESPDKKMPIDGLQAGGA